MKYRGFRDETLLKAAVDLEALGMKASEVHAVMNLAGAKWRSIQIREGRGEESHEDGDSRVFQEATRFVMQSTMLETAQLGRLGHTSEGERFMFLAISLTLGRLFAEGPALTRKWLREGEVEARKIVLSFAIGSCIIVEQGAIDPFFDRIVRFRYGAPFDAGKDISGKVLAKIERLGKAGYSVLKPIGDPLG